MEPFPKEAMEKVDSIGDLVVLHVWGPAQVVGLVQEKYFYSYMDEHTRYSDIYFDNTKDKVLKNFITFKEFLETQNQ